MGDFTKAPTAWLNKMQAEIAAELERRGIPSIPSFVDADQRPSTMPTGGASSNGASAGRGG